MVPKLDWAGNNRAKMIFCHKGVMLKAIPPVTLSGPVAKGTKKKLKKNSEKGQVFPAWLQLLTQFFKNATNAQERSAAGFKRKNFGRPRTNKQTNIKPQTSKNISLVQSHWNQEANSTNPSHPSIRHHELKGVFRYAAISEFDSEAHLYSVRVQGIQKLLKLGKEEIFNRFI